MKNHAIGRLFLTNWLGIQLLPNRVYETDFGGSKAQRFIRRNLVNPTHLFSIRRIVTVCLARTTVLSPGAQYIGLVRVRLRMQ